MNSSSSSVAVAVVATTLVVDAAAATGVMLPSTITPLLPWQKAGLGAVSAVLASALVYPLDSVATKKQTDTEVRRGGGALYSGILFSLAQTALNNYTVSKQWPYLRYPILKVLLLLHLDPSSLCSVPRLNLHRAGAGRRGTGANADCRCGAQAFRRRDRRPGDGGE